MTKATAADRDHFSRIAEASAAIEFDRQTAAASDDSASKIEEALRLSNALLLSKTTRDEHEVPHFSLLKRWRNVQAQSHHDRTGR